MLNPAGWLGLAYLVYWFALFLDHVVVPALILPLAGAPVVAWRLSGFSATLGNAALENSPRLAGFLSVLPLLLQVTFLLLVVLFGGRVRPASGRIALHFAAFWTTLLAASQAGGLAYAGRGELAHILTSITGHSPSSLGWRIAVTVLAALLLLAAGRLIAGQLMAEARVAFPLPRRAWLPVASLVVPVLLIIAMAANFAAGVYLLRRAGVAYLLMPTGACLLLGLLGLTWKRFGPQETAKPWNGAGAVAAVLLSAVLFAGLNQSAAVRRWVADRSLSPTEQAAAYEAVFRAFSGRSRFRGMYWWQWPSSGRGGGPRDSSYTPMGKPAQQVVGAWFARLAERSRADSGQKP